MTADSDDTIPERLEQEGGDDQADRDETERAEDGGSILDRLRGTGVGVEDPNIVGDPTPGPVDAEIAEDEPPVV